MLVLLDELLLLGLTVLPLLGREVLLLGLTALLFGLDVLLLGRTYSELERV